MHYDKICGWHNHPRPHHLSRWVSIQTGSPVSWCYDNNLYLNINKTKEMIVDCGKLQEAIRSLLRGSAVACSFLVDLYWTVHTEMVVWAAHFFFRRLKTFDMAPLSSQTFTDAALKALWLVASLVWQFSAQNRKALQRLVRTGEQTTGRELPAIQDTYHTRCLCGRPKW